MLRKAGLGLLALVILAFTPALGATYNYNVDIEFDGGFSVTGNIVTSCNNCLLDWTDIVANSFIGSVGDPIQNLGIYESDGVSDLEATSAGIYFISVPPTTSLTFGNASLGQSYLQFVVAPSEPEVVWWGNTPIGPGLPFPVAAIVPALPFQIAEFTDAPSDLPAATPLPGPLPLFSTGLTLLGLLGWRARTQTPVRPALSAGASA